MFIAAIVSPFIPTAAAEEPTTGITATAYNNWGYNNAPPLPPASSPVGTYTIDRVAQYFDWQPVFNLYEDFIVHYEGTITIPEGGSARFWAMADDGTILYIDDTLVTYDWYDKGGGGTISEPVPFTAGVAKPFELWYYENGGGAWVELWWSVNEGPWEIVPASAFSGEVTAPYLNPVQNLVATSTPDGQPYWRHWANRPCCRPEMIQEPTPVSMGQSSWWIP